MIGDRVQEAWTTFLDSIGGLISPDWTWLLSLVPLLLLALVLVVLLLLVRGWARNRSWNSPRVQARLTSPPPPPGTHLPGPSAWPFLIPLGGAVILFSLILKSGRVEAPTVNPATGAISVGQPASFIELVNVPVFLAGLLIALIGIVGWYLDAKREWRRAEQGHVEEEAAAAAAPPVAELASPPGVHLPGPSPWPFFAPIGLTFTLFGLIISPALLVGGILMCGIAILGWYRDAAREYRFVEQGQAPEPRTRDPERAFPKGLVGVFALIAVLSVAAAAAPQLLTLASAQPSASASASGGGGAANTVTITAKDIKFSPQQVTVAAGQALTIHFDNQDTVQHNIAIFDGADASAPLVFRGQIFPGVKSVDYAVPALKAGSYFFHCDVHPNMTGTITAK